MSGTERQAAFIDRARLFLKAGDGGDGCMSFRREKYIPYGGPNGGNGGNGGDIYFETDRNITTLTELAGHPHIRGKDGTNGQGSNKTGRNGAPITAYIPCGTVIKRDGIVIADMTAHGQKLLIARGGRGGRGNLAFKTRFNTAPKISEKGGTGEEIDLELELKVLADVGLIGLPNAGKSTFLSRISSARPKIADYPFTTLNPQLGVASHKNRSFVAADIPGLIEGAHDGKGLGDAFLKHIERTKILVQLVDPLGFGGVKPAKSVKLIFEELAKFNPALAVKPRILAINKADLPEAEAAYKQIKKAYPKLPVFLMSAATGKGCSSVLDCVIKLLNAESLKEPPPAPPAEPVARHTLEPAFRVQRNRDGVLEIRGPDIERLLDVTNFGQIESVLRLRNIFKKMGVDKSLQKYGVVEGETVRIGGREFEWSAAQTSDSSVSRRSR